MTMEELQLALTPHQFGKNDVVMLHFRLATAGGISQEMCHPFPLSDDISLLTAKSGYNDAVMGHNGILGRGEAGISDTALFVRDVLAPMAGEILSPGLRPLIELASSGSKIVILHSSGEYFLTGGEWKKDKGVYYSNNGYEPVVHWLEDRLRRWTTEGKTKERAGELAVGIVAEEDETVYADEDDVYICPSCHDTIRWEDLEVAEDGYMRGV